MQGRSSDELKILLSRLIFGDLTGEALEVILGHFPEVASTDQTLQRSKRVKPSNQGTENSFSAIKRLTIVANKAYSVYPACKVCPVWVGRSCTTLQAECTSTMHQIGREGENDANVISVPHWCEL